MASPNLPIQVYNGAVPPEGPMAIPQVLDFTQQGAVEFDIQMLYSLGRISCIQSIYVDNLDSGAPLEIRVSNTQQRITVPTGAQGYWPLTCDINATIYFSSASAAKIRVQLLNFAIANGYWQPAGGGGGPIGDYVETINGLSGGVNIVQGANVTVTTNPITGAITIAASGGGGGGVTPPPDDTFIYAAKNDGAGNLIWEPLGMSGANLLPELSTIFGDFSAGAMALTGSGIAVYAAGSDVGGVTYAPAGGGNPYFTGPGGTRTKLEFYGARLKLTADVPAVTYPYFIAYDTWDFDTGMNGTNFWATGGVLKIPDGAKFVSISAQVALTGSATNGSMNLDLYKNGVRTDIAAALVRSTSGFDNNVLQLNTGPLAVVAGDEFTLRVNKNGISGATGVLAFGTFLAVEVIG